jgi:phosphodiesterase/alkaline phosphatase D-like protein
MRPLCLAGLLALAAAFPATASAKGFAGGVASAEVSTSSALLWTRADKPGKVRLTVARDARLRRAAKTIRLRAAKRADNTVQRRITKLKPGTRYFFRFSGAKGARSDRGSFRTAPKASSTKPVRFAWTGDADPVLNPGTKQLHFGPFAVFKRMAREKNAFNVNLGDTIYSDTDSEFSGVDPLALTLAQKRAKYRTMLTAASLRGLRAAGAMYNHWDDHEFLNDFAIDQTRYPTESGTQEGQEPRIVTVDGRKLYADGVKAFREYMPVTYSKSRGIYRSFRWGKNLEVFFLDERSFRDAGADDNGTCDNPPGSGDRDLAPTAPQRIRTAFAAVVPQLASPPPPGCLERIDDPSRDYLGAAQFNRFTQAVKRSKATFKVVMNELPIQQFYVDPYDRWEGYAAERRRLIEFLRDNVRNVVFLTADVHANLVNDVRLRTLEDGGPVESGILEVTSGPSGTDTFKDDIEDDTNNSSAGDLANNFFLRQQPPNGPGIRCSNIDVFSYGQVTVTSGKLTIALKDASGRTVEDPDGKACGPYVVARR